MDELYENEVKRKTSHYVLENNFLIIIRLLNLQCFDAVGWAAGRASGL